MQIDDMKTLRDAIVYLHSHPVSNDPINGVQTKALAWHLNRDLKPKALLLCANGAKFGFA